MKAFNYSNRAYIQPLFYFLWKLLYNKNGDIMEIKLAYEDSYFDEKSRILGHCFTITENNRTFHYEFIPLKKVAKIQSDTTAYLEEVVQFFYKTHPTITTYYGNDFYMEMEKSF